MAQRPELSHSIGPVISSGLKDDDDFIINKKSNTILNILPAHYSWGTHEPHQRGIRIPCTDTQLEASFCFTLHLLYSRIVALLVYLARVGNKRSRFNALRGAYLRAFRIC